ncbi:MAG: hypothetical protein M3305_12700 [Actinomycetota bacterium]|nr:hypothetical protein [Actinomycetota bacterium]
MVHAYVPLRAIVLMVLKCSPKMNIKSTLSRNSKVVTNGLKLITLKKLTIAEKTSIMT